jgi:ribonuclease-3
MTDPRTEFANRWGLEPGSQLLAAALTHHSAEPELGRKGERLEFLGDALLGAMVASRLVRGLPEHTDEGMLTRARTALVRRSTLARAARRVGIDRLLVIGDNLRKQTGPDFGTADNDRLLADAFEAVLAVFYLERGETAAARFLEETLGDELADVLAEPPGPDPKNALQEQVQQGGGPTPTYRLVDHSNDGDRHRFRAEVLVDGSVVGEGEGPSRREAERSAARNALTGAAPEQNDVNQRGS